MTPQDIITCLLLGAFGFLVALAKQPDGPPKKFGFPIVMGILTAVFFLIVHLYFQS